MRLLFVFFTFCFSQTSLGSELSWADLSFDERASVLYELEYISDSELPKDTKVVSLMTGWSFDLNKISSTNLKELAEKVLETFNSEVSREAIDQSYFSSEGPIEVTSFYLLMNLEDEVLGGYMSVYQGGLDEEGQEADISWSANIRFNSQGELFLDEKGEAYDDLYFEWSGH